MKQSTTKLNKHKIRTKLLAERGNYLAESNKTQTDTKVILESRK